MKPYVFKNQIDKALADYGEAIRLSPKFTMAYFNRGNLWQAVGKLDKAIADYGEAIKSDPREFRSYCNRGILLQTLGKFDQALADFDAFVQLAPRNFLGYANRGRVWEVKGEYNKAIADYETAIKINPNHARSFNSIAWMLATCLDQTGRNGKRAVEMATKACELSGWRDKGYLDTLAASHAEAGNFAEAVKWQSKAMELASEKEKVSYRSRLDLYKAGKPYHVERKKMPAKS